MAETTTVELKVDLQCDRCFKKVKKVLCKFPEVRDQKYDDKKNTVTITVVSWNPERILTKIRPKAGCCIKSIEIKPPETKPPPPKKPETSKIVFILCMECHKWHPEGPCIKTNCISFPVPTCNENCGKKICCNWCGGSGCKGCSGHGWISWYCTSCTGVAPCKGCGSSSCGGCSGGGNWSWSSCKGCGSMSCGGGCSGGYRYYNSWNSCCKGCGSTSCSGCCGSGYICNVGNMSSSCMRCGSFWCSGSCGGPCGCGRCGH